MNPVPLSLSLVINQEEATLASRVTWTWHPEVLLAIASDGLPLRFIRGPRNVHKVFEITATTDRVEWVAVEAA